MFKSKTLFVVGAGASQEAGLPIGSQLTEKIAKLLNFSSDHGGLTKGDHVIFEALRKFASQQELPANKFLKSGREVAEAMELAQSIDTFLESHRNNHEYVLLGKLGIVRAISQAEKVSELRPTNNSQSAFRMKNMTDTWYYSLARQLFDGVPAEKPEVAFQNVTFLVFNYDRCLQTFLTQATQIYFRLTAAKAEELIGRVNIIHPYGSLGPVFPSISGSTPFGTDFSEGPWDINNVANGIRTFSESSDLSATIRSTTYNADTVIFLGFGFHAQNIELMNISQDQNSSDLPPKRVYATTKGMSDSDESVVRDQISRALFGRPLSKAAGSVISTNCGTCADLFSTYWRSLTA